MAEKKIKRKIFAAIGIIVLVVGLMVLLFTGNNYHAIELIFSGKPIEEILEQIDLGWKGRIIFGVLSMLQVILTVLPSEPIQVLSGMAYGFWQGVAICTAGLFVGNTLIYILYKVYGDKLTSYFQKNIEVDFEVLRSSKRVSLMIFLLYLVPAIPYGLICVFAASLKMKYPRYIILTVLGAIPSVMIGVALGHLTANNWLVSLVLLAVLIIAIVLLYVFRKKVFEKLNELAKRTFTYTSKTKVRKSNQLLNLTIFAGIKLWLRRRIKCRIKREVDKLELPAIVLCNHGSFIDFAYFAMLIGKEKPHIVANRQYFYERRLGRLLKSLGCIPKSMFTTDIENIKNCLQVIKDGGMLVICPEARLSTAGDFEDIQPGTMGFLRKMGANANIYTIKFSGDYLAMPKWAGRGNKSYIRKGSVVEAELKLLYSKGDSMQVTPEEFERQVLSAIDYNDFEWLNQHPELHYPQGNLAEGLENVLMRCPKCHSEFTFTTSGNTITCSECGFSDTMDDRYQFTSPDRDFDNLQQWYHWQVDELKREIEANDQFELRDTVKLFHSSIGGAKQLREAGAGECVFNRDGLTYTGTDSGQEITKFFPMSSIYRLLFGSGEDFEIYEGEEIWYFVPGDKRTCVKWYMASTIMRK